ncbi:MAG: phosphatidate cytidylyltransferase, partial [Neisseriaceae bacterium]|nr:phosphatidate cytidylyltransferase [Neisseriaceae bacterium]
NILLFSMWFCIISCFFLFTASLSEYNEPKFGNLRLYLLSILITIWANDAGAYFVGKAIGKHKFSPIISPNKTWEGFFGGMVIAAIILSLMYFDIGVAIYALIIAIFATIGDLFQSMLKRMAGVKDSGNIMPGHGGVFDRIDSWLSVGSMIFVVFVFALFFA